MIPKKMELQLNYQAPSKMKLQSPGSSLSQTGYAFSPFKRRSVFKVTATKVEADSENKDVQTMLPPLRTQTTLGDTTTFKDYVKGFQSEAGSYAKFYEEAVRMHRDQIFKQLASDRQIRSDDLLLP